MKDVKKALCLFERVYVLVCVCVEERWSGEEAIKTETERENGERKKREKESVARREQQQEERVRWVKWLCEVIPGRSWVRLGSAVSSFVSGY